MNANWEARFGCGICAVGAVWLSWAATYRFNSFATLLLPQGPVEMCAVGILAWLHAKYRALVLEQRAVIGSENTEPA